MRILIRWKMEEVWQSNAECLLFPLPLPQPLCPVEINLHYTKLLPVVPLPPFSLPPFDITHYYYCNFLKTLFMVFYLKLTSFHLFWKNTLELKPSIPDLNSSPTLLCYLSFCSAFSPPPRSIQISHLWATWSAEIHTVAPYHRVHCPAHLSA